MSVQAQAQTSQIGVHRLAGNIGAQITGADLAQPLDPRTVTEIRQALLAHKVIFFRDQKLDHRAQIAFARQFGELTHAHPHEDAAPEQAPEILTIVAFWDNRATAHLGPTGFTSEIVAGKPFLADADVKVA
jgi:hypothetical protein